jgi:alpha-beta hydrolase superfamily lysophospholipase
MTESTFTFKSGDGTVIHGSHWQPESQPPRGIVQIAHGMAEHALRYRRLAERLTAAGYAVWAHDHRGHGRSAASVETQGCLAEADGFAHMVADTRQVTTLARAKHPGLPLALMGHSMGSFVAQSYIQTHPEAADACILSSTNGPQGLMLGVATVVARSECRKKGRRAPSPRLNQLSFGSFNDAFKPARTDFDWLSRDHAEVDKYIADPYCGAIFPAGFFADFLQGLKDIERKDNLRRIRHDLPIYLFAGSDDPVGRQGKGPARLAGIYHKLGIRRVDLKLYPQGRHELLNDTIRDEVTADLIGWIDSCLDCTATRQS